MNEVKIKNSDIIFIYDAKLCNPNGDPDDENKPRMDYQTSRNLVSDVRLKRYIRDYLYTQGYEIFVSKIDDITVDATKRIEKLFENYEENGEKIKVEINKLEEKHIKWILQKVIDVRMFGATMPIKAKKGTEKGASNVFTGPVQFNWGYSLNKVQIVESSTITSMLAGRGEEYSTMGKDWRVYYSLIAFHGIISGKRAEKTMFSEKDIEVLDNALLKSIPQEATTRSKIGQKPRLLVRIEYINNTTFLGDLRRYIKIEPDDNLRDINEFELEVSKLVNLVKNNESKINKIYLWQDDDLKLKEGQIFKELIENDFKDKIIDLPHSEE